MKKQNKTVQNIVLYEYKFLKEIHLTWKLYITEARTVYA